MINPVEEAGKLEMSTNTNTCSIQWVGGERGKMSHYLYLRLLCTHGNEDNLSDYDGFGTMTNTNSLSCDTTALRSG